MSTKNVEKSNKTNYNQKMGVGMVSRDRLIFTFLLLLYIMASITRTQAKKASHAYDLQLCTTFNDQLFQTVTPDQNVPTFSAQEPLSLELLIPRMAGNEQDCKKGAQIVLDAVVKNELTSRELRLLLRHPLFRMSFHLPKRGDIAGEAMSVMDRFIIHINPNESFAPSTIRHELTHLFLGFVQSSQLDHETFPVNIHSVNMAQIFKNAGQNMKIDALQALWKSRVMTLVAAYKKNNHHMPLKPEEKSLLDQVKKAIEKLKNPETTIYFKLNHDDTKKFKEGETYPLSNLYIAELLARDSDFFRVIKLEKTKDNAGVTVQIDNPLIIFIIHQMKNLVTLQDYPAEVQCEEWITYATETTMHEAARVLYPEIFDMLNHYAQLLEATFAPAEYAVPADKEHYEHKEMYTITTLPLVSQKDVNYAYAFVARVIGQQKTASERDLDTALSIITQVIKYRDPSVNAREQAIHRVMFGEILYLRGHMKLAAQEFHKAYKTDKTAFTDYPQALQHHEEAVRLNPGSNPLTGSEKRELKKPRP
jgi:hypothetical protein